MISRFLGASVLGLSLIFMMGAGCGSSPASPSAQAISPEEMTAKLVFTTGDTFDIGQTFFGLGGLPSLLWKAQDLERHVTVDMYMPEREATLSWQASTEQETEASVKARDEYEKKIAARKQGEVYPPPPAVEMEIVTARGSVENIELQRSHTLSLPAYWLPGPTNLVGERSAVWLSQDAYLELERTGATDVYFDVTSQAASDLLKSSKDWVDALRRLRQQEQAAASERPEPSRLHTEGGKMDWSLQVNGQERKVKVLKAKNDFGELVILANQQNPLILKATVNPVFPGLGNATAGKVEWNTLFGYEVKRLQASLVNDPAP